MAVTLKDIARECGLAVSTVSNILNNHSSSFASEEARSRVQRTAERLGYKKDYLSSSLRTRTTKSIGLVLDQIHDLTRQEFLVPFVEQFSSLGYEVALAEHRHDPNRAVAALEGYAERWKDGVVLFTDLLGRTPEDQLKLQEAVGASSLKILGIGSRMKGLIPCLDIDRGQAVEKSLDHFVGLGRRSVLVVYEYDWDMRPRFGSWNRPGVTFWPGIHSPEDFLARARVTDWKEFDAVFFRTDKIAVPGLNFFLSRGLSVPGDLEVISFDNFPFSQYTRPALSTWDIGFHRLGSRAQEVLASWLAGTKPDPDQFELFLPGFVARDSHRGEL